jgi:hypothetical protein
MASNAAKAAENMLLEMLSAARFPDVSADYDTEKLLAIAKEYRPDAMAKVEDEFRREGRLLNWNYSSPGFIIDHLFSLDAVIAPRGSSHLERFGFDITLNPAEVFSKVKKLRRPDHIFHHLGVAKCVVIHLCPSPEWKNSWGWGLLNEVQREDLVERVVDIVYEMADNSVTVSDHTIYF